MTGADLARSYLATASSILGEAQRFAEQGQHHLAVRRAQEVVELALKAVLRRLGIEVPRVHDVGGVLRDKHALLPATMVADLDRIISVSRSLRRERETSFYGDDETGLFGPALYSEHDAREALSDAGWIFDLCQAAGTGDEP